MIGRWVFHLLRRHWSTYPFLCVHIPSSNWYAPTLPLLLLFVYASLTSHANSVGSQMEKKPQKSIRVNWHVKNNNWTVTHLNKQWDNHHYSRKSKNIYLIFSNRYCVNSIHTIFDLMRIESHQIELSSGKLRQRQLPHTYNTPFWKITRCVTRPSLSTAMDKAPWYGIREFRVYPKE